MGMSRSSCLTQAVGSAPPVARHHSMLRLQRNSCCREGSLSLMLRCVSSREMGEVLLVALGEVSVVAFACFEF